MLGSLHYTWYHFVAKQLTDHNSSHQIITLFWYLVNEREAFSLVRLDTTISVITRSECTGRPILLLQPSALSRSMFANCTSTVRCSNEKWALNQRFLHVVYYCFPRSLYIYLSVILPVSICALIFVPTYYNILMKSGLYKFVLKLFRHLCANFHSFSTSSLIKLLYFVARNEWNIVAWGSFSLTTW